MHLWNMYKNIPNNTTILFSVLYVTIILIPIVLAYRPVALGIFLIPGGAIIFPLSYSISDIVAEIYGYQIARQLFWCGSYL